MDTTIVVAFIALFGAIAVPFINHTLKLRREAVIIPPSEFEELDIARREALQGRWTGTAIQEIKGGGQLKSSIELVIKAESIKVSGNGLITHIKKEEKKEIKEAFTLIGGFFANKFARFTFDDEDPAKIQPGSMMLVLRDDTKAMNGHYIGYGSETGDLAMGTIELKKEA